ncbi:hypothetical protein THRCLA_11993 [Thraustotheca clavata]|uniref:Uncharacterized protein n=1 Tax=Thraustotheca clavata TaxID=74557 RepID=A0A1V9Y4B7_9STRA|nr:hypothetical protein THRCLA_11993 [Thraustotheca clavata]
MSEVFRDEMKERNETLSRVKQKCTILEKRLAESDGVMDNLRSNLDRRVYEMDTMRKAHYKEILMLRELVTRQKTDPYTLRALDEAIAELHSNRKKIMLSVEHTPSQHDINTSEVPQTDERVELLKNELEKRKQFIQVLRQDREKWEERAHDAITQLEVLKKDIAQRRESQIRQQPSYMSAWWFGGVESGTRERITIQAAIDSHVTSIQNVAMAAIEVLAIPSVWAIINTKLSDFELESEGAQKLQKIVLDLNPRPTEVIAESFIPLNEAPPPLPRNTSQIPCIHCNGLGIIDPTVITQENNLVDQHLQKTLQRVQELKTEIEKHVSDNTKLQAEKNEVIANQRVLHFKRINMPF